jgi:hypothetical protein
MVDDRLHEILLGVYGQRVDPIVRILHWPTFLESCRMFRQGTLPRVQATLAPSYPNSYAGSSPVAPYAFATLLYSIYFAALTAIQHTANPPDLGSSVNPTTLCSTFKEEILARTGLVQGTYARAESVELIQAIVIYMVSRSCQTCRNLLTRYSRWRSALLIHSNSGYS